MMTIISILGGFFLGFVTVSMLSANPASELDEIKNYLTHLFRNIVPQCEPSEAVLGLIMQIDNYIAGQNLKIKELEDEGSVQLKRVLEFVLEKAKEIDSTGVEDA